MLPLHFDETKLKAMHDAVVHRQSYVSIKTKAFSLSVSSLIPAQLQPTVVGPQYEGRLLDRLPVQPIDAPSLEWVQSVGSSPTGGTGFWLVSALGGGSRRAGRPKIPVKYRWACGVPRG